MKILQIANSLHIGGAEKLLVDSIPLYRAKGIDMELLLLNGTKTPFYSELEKNGVIIHSLSIGNIKTVYNPLHIFHIIPYLKKYDIIHVHLFPAIYWAALAKWLSKSKTKLIFTEHNTSNRRITKKGIWQIFDRFIYRQYNIIVSITSNVDSIIKVHLTDKKNKFKIINNGINIAKYSSATSSDTNNKKSKIIIQISSFQEPKDQQTVIRAMQFLPENVVLQLVGDGVTRKQCEQLVNDLNLSDRVLFLGVRTDVPLLLKSADIVIMSSHWEGFGLAAVEGMAACKPVIASDVKGLSEVVSNAGLLFEKGNAKDLAEKITSLFNDNEFYQKISQQCFERAKQYDINTMIYKYIDLYNKLLN